MNQAVRAALGAAVLTAGLAAVAPAALAGPPPAPNLNCNNLGGPGSPATPGATYNNVSINSGVTCTLSGNLIQGTVSGGNNSTLNISTTTVNKDVNMGVGSAISTNGAGNTFKGNLNMASPSSVQIGTGPNTFAKSINIGGISSTGNYICRAYVGKNLSVNGGAAGSDINVGDTTSNGDISTPAQQCLAPDAVAGDVNLNGNAGPFAAQFGGNDAVPPALATSGFCTVTDASSPPNSLAGWVGDDLNASNNTAGFWVEMTNVCESLTGNANASGANSNNLANNNTEDNFTAKNNTGTNNISGNHADHDANCKGNPAGSQTGNTAGHTNNCQNN